MQIYQVTAILPNGLWSAPVVGQLDVSDLGRMVQCVDGFFLMPENAILQCRPMRTAPEAQPTAADPPIQRAAPDAAAEPSPTVSVDATSRDDLAARRAATQARLQAGRKARSAGARPKAPTPTRRPRKASR